MTVDYIRYDILTQDALRSVVHTVLADVAAKGLPGEHHFFISIDTRAEGVGLSSRLKAQYPKEMTVVLQHQFWDMVVTDDRFAASRDSSTRRSNSACNSPLRWKAIIPRTSRRPARKTRARRPATIIRRPPRRFHWRPIRPRLPPGPTASPPPAAKSSASIVSEKNSAPARRSMTRPRPFRYPAGTRPRS